MSESTPTENTAAAGARSPRRSHAAAVLRRLAAEPFLHFIVLGLAIFVIAGVVRERRDGRRYRITLDAPALRVLAARWEKQYGAPPSAQQLASLVRTQVREEILYREGLDLRLDREDEIVRRRVAQKLEFLLQDLSIAKEPTEEELRAWYDAHAADYTVPARVSFTHVYFSPDLAGDEDAARRAAKALEDLGASGVTRAPERGDRFPYLHDHAAASASDVARLFGDSPFVGATLAAPLNRWSGPFRSGYGWHLVRVLERSASRVPPLAELREKATSDWMAAARERANDEAFEKLRAKYSITVADRGLADAIARR